MVAYAAGPATSGRLGRSRAPEAEALEPEAPEPFGGPWRRSLLRWDVGNAITSTAANWQMSLSPNPGQVAEIERAQGFTGV